MNVSYAPVQVESGEILLHRKGSSALHFKLTIFQAHLLEKLPGTKGSRCLGEGQTAGRRPARRKLTQWVTFFCHRRHYAVRG